MSIIIKGVNPPDDCGFCWFPNCNLRLITDVGERHPECPMIEVTGPLIDRNDLEKAVLKWMPHDPCGKEELERPFETDICVSMMMEIEEQEVIADADCVRTDSTHDIKNAVKAMPSIDLVLCRDCKEFYFADNRIPVQRGWVCGRYGEHRKPDDYCSKGEKVSEDD